MNYAVLLAGGSGTRLWPMSRNAKPKQLHNLVSEKSLLQETYSRVQRTVPAKNIFVATIALYVDEIKKQLPQVPEKNYLIELARRNTAPAMGLIALAIQKINPKAVIATIASDHIINNPEVFAEAMKIAYRAVEKYPDHLVAIGISPTKPETGFGYIKMGSQKCQIDGQRIFQVDKFVEKPDLATAQKYIRSWQYLWNACYYFFKAEALLGWLKKYRPKMYQTLAKIDKLASQNRGAANSTKIKQLYESIKDEQIEGAVVEQKTFNKTLVLPADLSWSDVGSWAALHDLLSDNFASSLISRGHHVDHGSENCLVYANEKMVATLGLKDVIIVDSSDVLLVANKAKSQDVKKLLEKLKEQGKHLYL